LFNAISKSNTPNQPELAVLALERMMKLHLEHGDIKPVLCTYTCVLIAYALGQGQQKCKKVALKLS
jgi:hypothetical protein